jgi:two-component system, LytTR family, sensor kinase
MHDWPVGGREQRAPGVGMARRLQVALWALLLWTALAVFFASQLYFAGLPWSQALEWSIPRWYAWGLLTPVVFRIDRRFQGLTSPVARFGLHVPLGMAFTSLSIVLRLVARPLRGAPWPPNLAVFFLERFYSDLLIYAVIAGVSISRGYAAQVRHRERQAAELALQAADLERRFVETRLQSLRAQLHPHFLFNALNTISAFTETNAPMARRLMGQLGDLLRASLTHAARPTVTLGEELTFLDDYLAIESARFEGRIKVSVRADDDVLGAKVPSFLLQPLVENAIKHGVVPKVSGGEVEVTAIRDASRLRLRVRDNGVGLARAWDFERDAGVGLRNVAARLEHLYGRGAGLRVTPQSAGVDVEIDLPLEPMMTAVLSRVTSA